MLIDCPHCNAQYDISENIILNDGHILECSNCLEIWKYTAPSVHEKTIQESFKSNKSQPQITPDIQSILREEATYAKNRKNLNKNGSRSTKRLKISKKDIQKLNLKIEENISITKLAVKKNKGRPSNKNKKSYKNSGSKIIIATLLIMLSTTGIYILSPVISKHVPQTKKPLEIYRLKVTNIYTNTRNSYTKFIVPNVNKLFNLE